MLLMPLAGCGSDSSPPFSLSCTTHRLHGGAIRAAVTVTNATSATANVIIYSPAFVFLQQIHPVLNPEQVTIQRPNHAQPVAYFGYAVPRVSPSNPAHLTLVFRPPRGSTSVAVTTTPTIQAQDLTVADNPDRAIAG